MGMNSVSGSMPDWGLDAGFGVLSFGAEGFSEVLAAGFGGDFGGRKNELVRVDFERLAFRFV